MYIVSYTTSGLFHSHRFSKLISKYVFTSLYLQIISLRIAQSLKVRLKCWLRTASTNTLVNNITIIEFLDHRYLKFTKEFIINSDSYINRLLSTLERNSNYNLFHLVFVFPRRSWLFSNRFSGSASLGRKMGWKIVYFSFRVLKIGVGKSC